MPEKTSKLQSIADGVQILDLILPLIGPSFLLNHEVTQELRRDDRLCRELTKLKHKFSTGANRKSESDVLINNDFEIAAIELIRGALSRYERKKTHRKSGLSDWKHRLFGSYGNTK